MNDNFKDIPFQSKKKVDIEKINSQLVATKSDLEQRGVNIKSKFGAKGDGTDDSLALENALNSNFTELYLPDGVYKVTRKIIVNSGSLLKKIIGGKNTVISVSLPNSSIAFDLQRNVQFESVTFDFNNSFLENALLYEENLGVISLHNLQFINVKDMDATKGCSVVSIPNKGNTLDINTILFKDLQKLGNGNVTDGGGSLTCLYLNDRRTAAPIVGTVKNIRVINVHNINASNAIIFEDTAGIYPISGYTGVEGFLTIENVYGYNFGKRLIKGHTSNMEIRDVYGYSDTEDSLSVIGLNSAQGLGDKKNITISKVKAYGKISIAIGVDASDVTCDNIVIDIQKPNMVGNGAYAWGLHLTGNQIAASNLNITAERAILFPKSTGEIWKNISIKKAVFTIPTWGVHGIHVNTGAIGFDNVIFEDVKVYNYSTGGNSNSFFETITLDGTGLKKGRGLKIINCSMYSTSLNSYSLNLRNIEDITITNFTFENDGVTKAARGIYLDTCKAVKISNFDCKAFSLVSVQTVNSTNVRLNGVLSPLSDYSLSNTGSTDVVVKDINKAKITLNDTTANQNTLVEQVTSYGTTANRPVSVTVGHQHFDTTLSKPIWWNGTAWKDATGTTV